MVFGAFLWILLAVIPPQSSPTEFVVHEIRACCHHQISLQCGDSRSKIAIIQARYVVDHENAETPGFHPTEDNHLGPSPKSISLWDMDLKFPHHYPPFRDGKEEMKSTYENNLNTPEWFSTYTGRGWGDQYSKKLINRLGQGPPGLNFTTSKVMEIPASYETTFMDRQTIWDQPLFPLVHTRSDLSPNMPYPCLSHENLSHSTKSNNFTSKKEKFKPNWHYMDFRPVFNQQCSGKSSCDVYLLWNQQRDEELTRVCHKWPHGFIVVKYLCFNTASGDAHAKCNEDIKPAREGFIMNPGYPDIYPGDVSCQWRLHVLQQRILLVIFDLSLREREKSSCRDQLIVSQDSTNLFSTCGDHSSAVAVLSLSHQVNVTLRAQSRLAYPKRGFLMYYRVLGCMTPEGPMNSNMVFRNATHAYFLCQVGHVFPDTLTRHRWLLCNPLEHHWTTSHLHCEDIRDLLEINTNVEDVLGSPGLWPSTHRDAYYRALLRDYIIPCVVLLSLFLINTIVLLYIRRRRNRQEEMENEENQEMEETQACIEATPEDSTFTLSSDGFSGLEWERPTLNYAEEETQLIIIEDPHSDFHMGHYSHRNSFIYRDGMAATYTNGNVYYTSFCRSTAV